MIDFSDERNKRKGSSLSSLLLLACLQTHVCKRCDLTYYIVNEQLSRAVLSKKKTAEKAVKTVYSPLVISQESLGTAKTLAGQV